MVIPAQLEQQYTPFTQDPFLLHRMDSLGSHVTQEASIL